MRYLLLVMAFVVGCSKPATEVVKVTEKSLPVFDFQGMHIGDELPERLKSQLKGGDREFLHERIADTKQSVLYTVIDGRIEGFSIEYENLRDAVDIYTQKLGRKPVAFEGQAIWETKDGLFTIDAKNNLGQIISKKSVVVGDAEHQKKLRDLGSKL